LESVAPKYVYERIPTTPKADVMDAQRKTTSTPSRKHLVSPEALARATTAIASPGLAGMHKQGNGVRLHGLYFAVVSLVALLLVIAAVVLASTMTTGFASTAG
jgi:hypothetical protein